MKSFMTAAMAALYPAVASSAMVRNCPGSDSDACYRWAVPSSSSASSSDVFFQIEAPSSYQWAGVGIGNQMRGAQIFVVYKDGSGNVTLSTRSGQGHFEPEYEQLSGVELLAGSGVKDGKMVANVRCSGDCSSSLDTSGENSWIAAWRSSGDLESTSDSAEITMHNQHYNFRIDLSQASVSSATNPFLASSEDSTNSGSESGSGSGSGSSSSSDSSDSDQGVSDDSSGVSRTILVAHGAVMAVAFAILYPLGAILMPVLGRWWIHALTQFVAFLLMWAGFGLGYYYSNSQGNFFSDSHMRLGTIVVALLGIQPILGWIHHWQYRKHQRRSIFSHVHIWYGRILIVLGIINGGMGLRLQNERTEYKIAYAVVAGVLGGLYIGAAIWGTVKRRRAHKVTSKGSSMSG